MLRALDEECARLAQNPHPVETIRGVTSFLAAMREELERVAALRSRALEAARENGASYDLIARATGLSKARVAQLVRGTRDAPPRHAFCEDRGTSCTLYGVEVYTIPEVQR